MTNRTRVLALAVVVLLLASALRFHRLEVQSFWNDEGNSARLSERSVAAIIEGTASDIHPPLYYLLLRGWREMAGETEFGLRALSAMSGVLTVALVFALGRAILGPTAARKVSARVKIVAALLAAVSPVMVYYSQETRMYALLALLAALSTWLMLVWMRSPRLSWGVAYALSAAAGLYTHYFFPAVLLAQGMAVLVLALLRPYGFQGGQRLASLLGRWLAPVVVAALLYLPWVPIFLRQAGGRGERMSLMSFVDESGRWLVLGATVSADEAIWAVVAAVVLGVMGVVRGRRAALLPTALVVVPLGLMAAVGATDPAFFKFLLVTAPFLCLLMGLAWRVRAGRLWLPGFLTMVVLAGSLLSLGNLYVDPAYARADYRSVAARVAADNGKAGVILVAPNQWEVFTYYHREGAPVFPLPLGRPDPELLEPELAQIASRHERLYVLFWGERQRDPESVIERWLAANTYKLSEEWVGDVRLAIYASGRPVASPVESGAQFETQDGTSITLRQYTVWPMDARPGDAVRVQLVWQAAQTPSRAYKVFVHLLAADGPPVAQHDGEPSGGSRPTTTWEPDEPITDNHGLLLPADLPPGRYTLRLGLYDALDPSARLVVDGSDGMTLGEITVSE